jgi:DNA-binding MarR family transcriptional regulator
MEIYVLTQAGRDVISRLQREGREEDAKMLEYLGLLEGATVKQVAEMFQLDEAVAYDRLRSLSANRWVWLKKTKLTLF